jgi:hypothetical protein
VQQQEVWLSLVCFKIDSIQVYPGVLLAKDGPNLFWKIMGGLSAVLSTILGITCTVAIILDTFNIVSPK